MKSCCITGHRPNKLPWKYTMEGDKYDNYIKQLSLEINYLIYNGYTHFNTGMALGVDMDFADIILWLRDEKQFPITLKCAILCPEQTFKWMPKQIERYNLIINRANFKTIVSKRYDFVCMQKRNEYMIDKSDIVIAVWNGIKKGGTWNAINYAMKIKRNVVILNV